MRACVVLFLGIYGSLGWARGKVIYKARNKMKQMKQNPQQGQKHEAGNNDKSWAFSVTVTKLLNFRDLFLPQDGMILQNSTRKKNPKPFLIFEDKMQVVSQIREQRNKLWHPKATHTPKLEKQRCLSEAEHPVQERLIFVKCAAMFSSFGSCQTMKEKINKNFSAQYCYTLSKKC